MSVIVNDGKVIVSGGQIMVNGNNILEYSPRVFLSAELEVARFGYADAAALATVIDWSGNGFAFTQGTAANRATIRTNVLNGFPVFRFDGTNDQYSSAFRNIWTSVAGATQVHVYKRSGGNAASQNIFATVYGSGGGGKGLNIIPSNTSSQISGASRRATGGTAVAANTGIGYDLNWHIVIATVDFPTGLVKLFMDGVLVNIAINTDLAATTDSVQPTYVYFGSGDNGSGTPNAWFNGDVAMTASIERCLTDTEVDQIYESLKTKYDL